MTAAAGAGGGVGNNPRKKQAQKSSTKEMQFQAKAPGRNFRVARGEEIWDFLFVAYPNVFRVKTRLLSQNTLRAATKLFSGGLGCPDRYVFVAGVRKSRGKKFSGSLQCFSVENTLTLLKNLEGCHIFFLKKCAFVFEISPLRLL